jgi:hypothetical protein
MADEISARPACLHKARLVTASLPKTGFLDEAVIKQVMGQTW